MQALEGFEAAALRARDPRCRRRRRDARNVVAGDGTHDHRLPRTSPLYADRHGKRVIFAKKLLAGGIDQLTKWRGETRPKFTSPRLFKDCPGRLADMGSFGIFYFLSQGITWTPQLLCTPLP